MRSSQNNTNVRSMSSRSLPAISEDAFEEGELTNANNSRWITHQEIPAMPYGSRHNLPVSPHSRTYMSDSDNSDSHPSAEKPNENPKNGAFDRFSRRGGWKRLSLIAIAVILGAVGLIVGLVIGLRKKNSESNGTTSSNSNGNATSPAPDTSFPAGFYRFDTFLTNVSTGCSSNPLTWRCYPYATYSESPVSSDAIFDWIIQPTSPNGNSYTVSSTNNPFSLVFINATMTLLDANSSTERYTFQVPMNKPVIPASAITSSNTAATCYFNSTIFQGNLYTRIAKSYPTNGTTNTTAINPKPWPYAVSMEQVASSGSNTPECFDSRGNLVGNFSVQEAGQQCSCQYMNYGN